jgi:glycolate oxidase
MTLDNQTPRLDTAPSAAAILAPLEEVLPRRAILTGREDTTPYECDGLTAYRATPLGEPLMRIQRAVKAAFDPDGILNPGRLYPGL